MYANLPNLYSLYFLGLGFFCYLAQEVLYTGHIYFGQWSQIMIFETANLKHIHIFREH